MFNKVIYNYSYLVFFFKQITPNKYQQLLCDHFKIFISVRYKNSPKLTLNKPQQFVNYNDKNNYFCIAY